MIIVPVNSKFQNIFIQYQSVKRNLCSCNDRKYSSNYLQRPLTVHFRGIIILQIQMNYRCKVVILLL
jgi:hypothetical protein